MKNLFTLFVIVLLAGCVSVQPVGDTTAPELMIHAKTSGPGLGALIASSDPNQLTPSLGCPLGTFMQGQRPSIYYVDLPRTVSIGVTSSDKGAVRFLSIDLLGVQKHEVTSTITRFDTMATVLITQVNPAQVRIDATFSNLRTAQTITFDVAIDEHLVVTAETGDFNNNNISVPLGATGGADHGGLIRNVSDCN